MRGCNDGDMMVRDGPIATKLEFVPLRVQVLGKLCELENKSRSLLGW